MNMKSKSTKEKITSIVNEKADDIIGTESDCKQGVRNLDKMTLDEIDKGIEKILDDHQYKGNFIKGELIVDCSLRCSANLYFYNRDSEKWFKETITFKEKEVLLSEEHKAKDLPLKIPYI